MEQKKFYITTAIAYTSRKPHIGNTYEVVLTDAIARFRRQIGQDVYFLTGTDEHGQKIQQESEKLGIAPKAYVDNVAGQIREIWDLMGASYDGFIRTTDEQHEKVVQKIFKKLYDQGDIYKSEYEGWYCVPCESFFTESQLVDGCCPDCGRKVEKAKEESYFFRMSKYQDRLMKHIEENPDFIQPESRKKEMVNNFLKPGLQDLCVSRSTFTWGVPVPFDPKHVIYVWIDALSNYITALGYDPDGSSDLYKKYWPADVHVIGKDILRFHTIYWPIMLMALGEPLPKQIFGHPWLLFGNDKMSKSKGNVMYADDLVGHFGVDAIRFYLLHEMPFAQDGSITYETIISRYNSELANTLGNLVNRSVSMLHKYFGGVLPAMGTRTEVEDELVGIAQDGVRKVVDCMQELRVADAMDEIWNIVHAGNKYIDKTMPWALAKDEAQKERLGSVMYHLLESIRYVGVLLESFMPETSKKILEQLATSATSFETLSAFGALKTGDSVGKPEPLFARLDEAKKLEEIMLSLEKEEQVEPLEHLPEISIDDFSKCELRVARVLECEPVKGSDKLLKFQLDLGAEQRQVVSGIAKFYQPDQLVGKNVIVVCNLKPVKLRGEWSNGMILSAEKDGKLTVLMPSDEIAPGSLVC